MRTTVSHPALLAALAAYAPANEGRGGIPPVRTGGGTQEVEVSMGGSSSGSIHMDNEGGEPTTVTGEGNGSVEVGRNGEALDATQNAQTGTPEDQQAADDKAAAAEDAEDKTEDGDTDKPVELPEFKPGEDGKVDPAVVEAYDKVYKTDGKLDLAAFSAEWWGNAQATEDGTGHLDEGAYAYLDHIGVPKDMVKQIEAGQMALNNQRDGVLYQRAGGKPNFEAAFKWATNPDNPGYTPEQKAAFNRAIDGDDSARADAVDLLMTRFDKANASKINPRKSAADEAGSGSGEGGKGANGEVYHSKDEWLAARKEAGRDMAKQAEVSRRFRRSPGAKNW